MSTFTPQPNSGSLFKNNKKTEEKQPDYTGSLMVGTNEMRLAAWVKKGKNGSFLSIKLTDKRSDTPNGESTASSDDLPF